MKIVVFGGSGLIGTKVVQKLGALGHEVAAASPQTGVNAVTGDGLMQVLQGAEVTVDLMNSPSFEEEPVMAFFQTTSRNILAAANEAGVAHHVALSVVGTDRLQDVAYFRAKLVQERLIQESGISYTIVRATQFFEFLGGIAESYVRDGVVRVSQVSIQPMAAEDVATGVADQVVSPPLNGITDIAGPERMTMDEAVRRFLASRSDVREIVIDDSAGYFGAPIDDQALTPLGAARLGSIRLNDWLQPTMHPVG